MPKSNEKIKVGDFFVTNKEKYDRAVAVAGDDNDLILAHYDKLGGRILDEDGDKVKMGKFWSFTGNKPRKTDKKENSKDEAYRCEECQREHKPGTKIFEEHKGNQGKEKSDNK